MNNRFRSIRVRARRDAPAAPLAVSKVDC